jgi:lipoprotein-releasing system permease protein
MFRPLELFIGLRYTRAKRRNHFISFISLTSMLGVTVGVAALITVLSVMNGFEREIKQRILGMTAHATVRVASGQPTDWRDLIARLKQPAHVLGVAPFVTGEAMLSNRGPVQGVLVQGVLPNLEPSVSMVAEHFVEGRLADLRSGGFGIALGAGVAQALRVGMGEKITLISPQPNATPAGVLPRLKQFTVRGIFEVGMNEFDSKSALIHFDDAVRMFRVREGLSGLRLRVDEVMQAPSVAQSLRTVLGPDFKVEDWTQSHVNFYKALATEKTVMFVVLLLIVAVAAFNIISTLVMVVADKESDIAILRTMGLAPFSVMLVFIVQGIVIGFAGTALGTGIGVWLATHLHSVVPALEALFGIRFLDPSVFYISELPSEMRWPDVAWISGIAFLLTLLATLYPSWRAGRVQPAEALRYE